MDEEGGLGQHIMRALALLVGVGAGFVAVYLLVAITAGSRRGDPIAVDKEALAASALEAPLQVAAAPPAVSGEEIFHQRCAFCHGPKGRGDGPMAPHLSTAPRDLVQGPYWMRSTPADSAPTRDDLKKVVERGVVGTAMPGFEAALVGEELEDTGIDKVVDHLISRSRYLRKPGTPIELEEQASGEDWEIEAGRAVYDALDCASCHGPNGYGDGPKAAELKDARGQKLRVPDLTAPWEFRRGPETHHIWQVLELGMGPRHMPALTAKSSKGDRLALAVFVRSMGRKLLDTGEMKDARERRGIERQGENMVRLLACGRCHTPLDGQGLPRRELDMAGGSEVRTPQGTFFAANLTPHSEGLQDVSDELVLRTLTEGRTRDGRAIDPLAMPWTWYSKLTSSDAQAIVAHLRTLPARSNPVDGETEADAPGMGDRLSLLFGGGKPGVELLSRVAAATADTEPPADADPPSDQEDDNAETPPAKADPVADAKPEQPAADPTEPEAAPGDDDPALQSPEARRAVAKARYEEANLRLNEAAAAFARAKAEYEKVQAEQASSKGKKKKKGKKRRGKRRRR